MGIIALKDINSMATDLEGGMWDHIKTGDVGLAVQGYNDFLRAIGTPNISDAHDQSVFDGRSPFLGDLGPRHLTTPQETQAIMSLAADYHALAHAKLTVADVQGMIAHYGENYLPHMGTAITLANTMVAGKTPREPEFAKLIGYTGWASSGPVAGEVDVILSGQPSDYRIFPSEDGSQRFSLQTEKGAPIVSKTELQAELSNSNSKGVFVYHYSAEDQAIVPADTIVQGLPSHTHKNPTNYPTALTGMGVVNLLSRGLSVINLAKDAHDGPAVAHSRWEESNRAYLGGIAAKRGLSNNDIDILSRGIQLTTNRGWDGLTSTFGAVTSHNVGLVHQQNRAASESLGEFERSKMMLELGAGNGYHIDDGLSDAELEAIAVELFNRVSSNNGRVCVRPDLITVHENVYGRFATVAEKLFKDRDRDAESVIGSPLDPSVTQGSFFNQNEYDEHLNYKTIATKNGASVIGGRPVHHDYTGLYASPLLALFDTEDAKQAYGVLRDNSHEVFSSVMNVMPVSGADEAIEMMNRSSLCLADGLATHDLETVFAFKDNLKMGGSFHVNLSGKRISDEAPANAHGHGVNPPQGIQKNAGVTGGLDCLRQMFNVPHRPAEVSVRLPKEMIPGYLDHYGLHLK